MPFTIPLTFDWLKHRLYAAQRILYRRRTLYFVDKNLRLRPIMDQRGKYILCPICGFSIADLEMKEGWVVRACSAIGFNHVINNPNFEQWLIEVIKDKDSRTPNNPLSIQLK